MQDRNFDDIAEKFSRNIYGTTKGQLRQAILWQDLDRVLAEMGPQKLRVLDAGGGEGQTEPFEQGATVGRGRGEDQWDRRRSRGHCRAFSLWVSRGARRTDSGSPTGVDWRNRLRRAS